MIFIFGIEEVARYVAVRQDLMSAVHVTGRYAIVHGSSSSSPATAAMLQQMVGNKLVMINAASVTSNANFSPNNSSGSTVTITASYTWTPLVAILNLPSANISVTSTATILH